MKTNNALAKTNNLSIQSACDIDDVSELYSIFSHAEHIGRLAWQDKERLERLIKRNGFIPKIASYNHEIIGFCLAGHDGMRGKIGQLYVIPSFRKAKIGKELVEETLLEFKKEKIYRVQVSVETENHGAQQFWKSNGFRLSTGTGGIITVMTIDL